MPDAVTSLAVPSRRFVALAAALLLLLPLYFVIPASVGNRAVHVPAIFVDHLVPVEPGWMYVYGSIYVFVLLPLLVVRQEELFCRAIKAYLLVLVAAYTGFIAYPAAAPRPSIVPAAGFASWCLRLTYSIDSLYNCFPSLHVAHSFVSALTCYRVNRGVGIAATGWAALIGISTLFVKQHYAVDVLAGALVAALAYALFLRSYPRAAVANRDCRMAPRRALGVVVIFGIVVAVMWLLYRSGIVRV